MANQPAAAPGYTDLRARSRCRASRHQAGRYVAAARRVHQDHGFRHLPHQQRQPDAGRIDDRNSELHVARTMPRSAGRCARRPVLGRDRAVRDADRRETIPWLQHLRNRWPAHDELPDLKGRVPPFLAGVLRHAPAMRSMHRFAGPRPQWQGRCGPAQAPSQVKASGATTASCCLAPLQPAMVSRDVLGMLQRRLVQHVGPVARIILGRAMRKAPDLDALLQKQVANIASPQERKGVPARRAPSTWRTCLERFALDLILHARNNGKRRRDCHGGTRAGADRTGQAERPDRACPGQARRVAPCRCRRAMGDARPAIGKPKGYVLI